MNINQDYDRRIRIESNANVPLSNGRNTYVYDVDTGETITNILRMVVYLDGGRKLGRAEVTYAEMDEGGKPVAQDGELVEGTINVEVPEIAVTVIEEKHHTWEEKIDSLVTLAKAAGRYINSEETDLLSPGTRSDYYHDAQRKFREAYADFCEWRHKEPYVVDEIKELLKGNA